MNGFPVDAAVDERLIEDVLLPRLRALSDRRSEGRRTFVFLAAPPGTGKSTLAAVLLQRTGDLDLAVVGVDGFHHAQSYLDAHHVETVEGSVTLASVKGCPESFDIDALTRHLAEARDGDVVWPAYDRTVHDVVAGEPVRAGLVLVEGNWLLLDEPGWAELKAFSSLNVFVDADPSLLRERLVQRKVRGGLTQAEAEDFYERSDRLNAERVLARTDRSAVDLLLHLHADGTIKEGGSQ